MSIADRSRSAPNAALLIAPPTWRRIDFISDLHLSEDLPDTTAALAGYLERTSADAVLILGDLFEAWVGDDMRDQPYEVSCVHMLAKAGRRLYLGVMAGNRDFLLGEATLNACHAHRIEDPTVLQAWGRRVLLIHGDELCLSDVEYLRFRSLVRSPEWQQQFLQAPLHERLMQARHMRQASQTHQTQQGKQSWADVDEDAAGAWMRTFQTDTLVHGHTHRPADAPFGPAGGMRHVLSDWDLDHGHPRAEVLRLSEVGFERISLETA
jgi:UDP-2,3-diacylglucosamine hydrolase